MTDEPNTPPHTADAPTSENTVTPVPLPSQSVTVPAPEHKPYILLSKYLDDVPVNVRLSVYNKIRDAVKDGELLGLVNQTEKFQTEVIPDRETQRTRSLKKVLIPNTDGMVEKLDTLAHTAIQEQIRRTGGRRFSMEEIVALGADLDFEALARAARERAKAKKKSGKLKRKR